MTIASDCRGPCYDSIRVKILQIVSKYKGTSLKEGPIEQDWYEFEIEFTDNSSVKVKFIAE